MPQKNPSTNDNEPIAVLNTPERKPCTACKVLVHFSWRYCPACGTPTDYLHEDEATRLLKTLEYNPDRWPRPIEAITDLVAAVRFLLRQHTGSQPDDGLKTRQIKK